MMPFDPDLRYRAAADAMESRLGDETVILHLGSGTYFGLDAVGSVVWERLGSTGGTLAEICADVRANFSQVPDSMEDEIRQLLDHLADHGLIRAE